MTPRMSLAWESTFQFPNRALRPVHAAKSSKAGNRSLFWLLQRLATNRNRGRNRPRSLLMGAIVSHLRVGAIKGIGPAAFMLVLATGALTLRILTATA
jgi:hypothetical protein